MVSPCVHPPGQEYSKAFLFHRNLEKFSGNVFNLQLGYADKRNKQSNVVSIKIIQKTQFLDKV